MMAGIKHIIAKPLIPKVAKLYRASKNRRKSKATLPPCSWVYVLNALIIILRDYFLLQSVPFETYGRRNY